MVVLSGKMVSAQDVFDGDRNSTGFKMFSDFSHTLMVCALSAKLPRHWGSFELVKWTG
jgi:hypothetical protein